MRRGAVRDGRSGGLQTTLAGARRRHDPPVPRPAAAPRPRRDPPPRPRRLDPAATPRGRRAPSRSSAICASTVPSPPLNADKCVLTSVGPSTRGVSSAQRRRLKSRRTRDSCKRGSWRRAASASLYFERVARCMPILPTCSCFGCGTYLRGINDVDIPWRRVAAPPRPTTWIFRGDGSRRRRGCSADRPLMSRGRRRARGLDFTALERRRRDGARSPTLQEPAKTKFISPRWRFRRRRGTARASTPPTPRT